MQNYILVNYKGNYIEISEYINILTAEEYPTVKSVALFVVSITNAAKTNNYELYKNLVENNETSVNMLDPQFWPELFGAGSKKEIEFWVNRDREYKILDLSVMPTKYENLFDIGLQQPNIDMESYKDAIVLLEGELESDDINDEYRLAIKNRIDKIHNRNNQLVHYNDVPFVNVPVVKKDKIPKGVITITFGERVENHARMQMIGNLADSGFSIDELKNAKRLFELEGANCELIHLNSFLPTSIKADPASILIIRNGVNVLNLDASEMMIENLKYDWDKKAKMKGKVVNKHARWNVCISDYSQEPLYKDGKGRVINFKDVPITKKIRELLPKYLGTKAKELNAEGNYYYDKDKCFIRQHGDVERRKVIAVRLGESFPLSYQWFQHFKPISDRYEIMLNHGDIYIMSEKAVGTDWMKSSIPTLRHSAGLKTHTEYKQKKPKKSKK